MPGSELPSPALETASSPGIMEADGGPCASVFGNMPHFLKVFPPPLADASMQNVSLKAGEDGKTVELERMGSDERDFFFCMYGKDVVASGCGGGGVSGGAGQLDNAVLVCIEAWTTKEENSFVGIDYVQSQCGLCTDVVLKTLSGGPAETTYVGAMEQPNLLWYKMDNGITPAGYPTFTLHPHFSRDVVLCCQGDTNKLCLLPLSEAKSSAGKVFTTFFWEPL